MLEVSFLVAALWTFSAILLGHGLGLMSAARQLRKLRESLSRATLEED